MVYSVPDQLTTSAQIYNDSFTWKLVFIDFSVGVMSENIEMFEDNGLKKKIGEEPDK